MAHRRAGHGKIGVQGFRNAARSVQRQATVKAVMPSRLDPPDMPRLDVLDEEFGDAAAVLHARRRRIGARLLMLRLMSPGITAICALAFAWSKSDARLRLKL